MLNSEHVKVFIVTPLQLQVQGIMILSYWLRILKFLLLIQQERFLFADNCIMYYTKEIYCSVACNSLTMAETMITFAFYHNVDIFLWCTAPVISENCLCQCACPTAKFTLLGSTITWFYCITFLASR